MSQLELYFSKRHICSCAYGAIIFLSLQKRLRRRIFREVVSAFAAQLL